jgi:hypothetical protein
MTKVYKPESDEFARHQILHALDQATGRWGPPPREIAPEDRGRIRDAEDLLAEVIWHLYKAEADEEGKEAT